MSPPAVTPPVTRTRPSAKLIAAAFARAMDIAAADVTDPLDKISAAETGPAALAPTMSIRPSGSRAAEEPHRTSPANSGAGAPGAAISIQAEGTSKPRTARLNKPVRDFIENPFRSQTLVPGNAK